MDFSKAKKIYMKIYTKKDGSGKYMRGKDKESGLEYLLLPVKEKKETWSADFVLNIGPDDYQKGSTPPANTAPPKPKKPIDDFLGS